jgi:hypothetical protein
MFKAGKRKLILSVVFLYLSILYSGCQKDLEKLQDSWNPAMAIPVIDGSMNFEDLVASADTAYIKTNPDKSIYFVYRSSFPSPTAEELIPIPKQDYRGSYNLNAGQIVTLQTLGFLNISYTDTIRFDFTNNERIDLIEFKGGNLDFRLSSMIRDCVEVTLSIPALRSRTGVPFNKTFDLNYTNQQLPIRDAYNVDLNGYKVDLSVGNTSSNKIPVTIGIRYRYIGNPISPSDTVRYDVDFTNIRFSYLAGYIGKHTYAMPEDSILFNVFNNTYAGKVTLSRPQLNLYFTNSYGVPLAFDLSKCRAFSTTSPPLRLFKFDTLHIAAPATRNDPPKRTILKMANPDSINLISILEKSPNKLEYAVGGVTNPTGGITQTNFVKDTSRVRADIETIIPLELSINGLALQDTFDFNMEDNKLGEKIELLKIKFVTQNEFPVNIGIQVYFVDAAYNKLDSLISPYQEILASAIPVNPADPGSRAVPAPHKVLYFQIDKPRVEKVIQAKYVILKGVMNTYSQGGPPLPVRFYSDYKLKVKMGVFAQGKPFKKEKNK